MTDGWINLRETLAELAAGPIWSIDSGSESLLTRALHEHDFQLYFLHGSQIADEEIFFQEAATCFGFPDYFGKNWDAFNDCLGELIEDGHARIAVIWRNSSTTAERNLPTLVAAAHLLLNAAEAARREKHPVVQMEIFFLGEGHGFLQIREHENV